MSRQTRLLSWHSRDLGIPKSDLREMCLRAGLEQLNRGQLKVGPVSDRLPVFLPRNMVLLLREMCEEAAELQGGADAFVEAILEDMVNHTPQATEERHEGIVEMISSGWILGGEEGPQGVVKRMVKAAQGWEPDDAQSVRRKS